MIDDHSFQQMPRNLSQLQLKPQSQSSFNHSVSNAGSNASGTLDMTFNRQPLDWAELECFAPHSTHLNQQTTSDSTEYSSVEDLRDLLDQWSFPSQPAVPPRLILWGPYSKPDRHRKPVQTLPSPPRHLYPQTPPSYDYQAPKRRREPHFPPAQPRFVSPLAYSKRPRTAEKLATKFTASTPHRHHLGNLSAAQISPPHSQASVSRKDHSIDHRPLGTPFHPRHPNLRQAAPLSSKSPNCPNPARYESHPSQSSPLFGSRVASVHPGPLYAKNANCQTPGHRDGYFPNSPLLCSPTVSAYNSSSFNHFYLPSPVSPTTPFPQSFQSSAYPKLPLSQSPCAHKHDPSRSKHAYSHNVWSQEWHRTFHQFRNENRT